MKRKEKKMTEQITDQEKQLVVQSNPLVEAQYKLDLIEQKVLRYIISMIRPYDTTLEKRFYRVRIEEFEKFLGWVEEGGKIFNYIKRVADRLKATTIKIIKPNTTIVTSWIASYEYPKNFGWIEFEFSSKLESELLKLKEQFTQYYLKNISKLKSQYSIRLYELLKQYAGVGQRKESIANLRAILGIGENEYQEFKNFKMRVLKGAQSEICKKTDIDFDFTIEKLSRKPIAVVFYIQQKTFIPDRILSLIPKKFRDSKQVLNVIRKYIELCGEDYVSEKLNYTNAQNPKKWANYLALALQNDYGAGYTPGQESLPGVFEALDDGTKIEIGDQIYTVQGGMVSTGQGVIPQGPLVRGIKDGKFKIVS